MHDPEDEETLWPRWVGEDSGCDVWTLGFDAAVSAWSETAMGLPEMATALLDCIDSTRALDGRPLILVGHSLGGLVVKQAILHAAQHGEARFQRLMPQFQGVVFAATPHQGSIYAGIAVFLRLALRTNDLLSDLKPENSLLDNLKERFNAVVTDRQLRVRVFREVRPTRVKWRRAWFSVPLPFLIVNKASSNPGLQGVTPVVIEADHIDICKPADRNATIHKSILKFIREGAPAVAAPEPARAVPLPVEPPRPNPAQPARLSGAGDRRLAPRETKVFGREREIDQVVAFLNGEESAVSVCAQIAGGAGIGKTEVCKAALKCWLERNSSQVAFYVDVPDRSSALILVAAIGAGLGQPGLASFAELAPHLAPGLYFLDNLEGALIDPAALDLLRRLKDHPGVRLLASTRADLTHVMGRPIEIGVLDPEPARTLFRSLWTGSDFLPEDAELDEFLEQTLGRHALSIALTARLGAAYSFVTLRERWRVRLAGQGAGRIYRLEDCLDLSREYLAQHPGALSLWALAALFPDGLTEAVLNRFEDQVGGPDDARGVLSRHYLWERRADRFFLLPPIARYALEQYADPTARLFPWPDVRRRTFEIFGALAETADSVASTQEALAARAELLSNFSALHRWMILEFDQADRADHRLSGLIAALRNLFQFSAPLAVEILRSAQSRLPESANMLQSLGDLEGRLGDPESARTLYNRALELYEREQSSAEKANTLKSLGDLESRLGDPDAARACYNQALALFEREQAGLGQANTLKSLGDLELRLGDPGAARARYDRALALFEREQAGLGQANTLRSLGDLERRLGEPDSARARYDRAMVLHKREQDGLGQANTLISLGDLELRIGNSRAAREHYDRAMALYEREQSGLGQANTLKSLGDLDSLIGDLRSARARYDRAMALYEREQSALGQANTLVSLGDLENFLGDPASARARYDRALEMYEREQDGLGQANTLRSLGDLERAADRPDAALALYHRALALYECEQAPAELANTLAECGRCHHTLAEFPARDRALARARAEASRSGFAEVVRYVEAVAAEFDVRD